MAVDFPRAWQIARASQMSDHDPRCSYRTQNGALLCDCHVVNEHPDAKRRKLIGVKHWYYLFRPRFAADVRDKKKKRTMRPEREDKKRPALGDHVSLRTWSGLPYRSPQIVLRTGVVTNVQSVFIDTISAVGLDLLAGPKQNEFARADGFQDYADMLNFFQTEHGLPFEGVLIEWEPYDNTPTQLHESTVLPTPTHGR